MDIRVTSDVIKAIRDAAACAHPEECCGMLLGVAGRITAVQAARNVHKAPLTHFEIDPQALIDAHRAQRQGGQRVMGYYHSHPQGEPIPSTEDRAKAAGDGMIWAIAAGGIVRFWKSTSEGFTQLSLPEIGG